MPSSASAIRRKVETGERLEFDEGVHLLEAMDLAEIGELAQVVRYRHNPEPVVTFIVDTNLNYTNVCNAYCTFCAFYRTAKDADAYTHSVEGMMQKIAQAREKGVIRVLMQGGLNEALPMEYYCELVSETIKRFPDVNPHFFSPPEIYEMARVSKLTYRQVLQRLYDAGQRTMPGGGAEILTDRVRDAISPLKVSADDWIQIMRDAHAVGFETTATMVYGHLETAQDITLHLDRVRRLQDETGGFIAFIPWSFRGPETPLGRKLKGKEATGDDYLRVLAASRLYLDNVQHIQGSWFSEGKAVGMQSLHWGCDDFGSTLFDE
ncbi:MAG TPA: CofH family radical SAM protein, partial [Limnochordia bacterium]|nr:CofH family radical SAM protein [Limnochordia bacterium]